MNVNEMKKIIVINIFDGFHLINFIFRLKAVLEGGDKVSNEINVGTYSFYLLKTDIMIIIIVITPNEKMIDYYLWLVGI